MQTPIQVVLGIPDAGGALFLFADDMRAIGGPDDCDRVLAVVRLCDGSRTTADIVSTAAESGIAAETARAILEALYAAHVVIDGDAGDRSELQRANRLIATFVGSDRLVTELDAYRPCVADDTMLPYFAASGRFKYPDGVDYVSFGTAETPEGAVLRAIAEAVERFAHGSDIRIDAFGTADVGPTRVFDAVTCQQRSFLDERGFVAYDPTAAHPWVRAESLASGKPTYVLADTVYYPATEEQLGRPLVSDAIASGTAAHFDRGEAIRRGLLEVIERDALAVMWWSKRPVTALPLELASPDIQQRIAEWEQRGREFRLIDLTTDSVPVVLALSRADSYPYVTAGCAAATTYAAAIEKAYLESETIAHTWAVAPEPKQEPDAFLSAMGHGLLYAHRGNEHRLAWLYDGPVVAPTIRPIAWDELVARFEPLVVDLRVASSADDLWVVKVLSDELLPITFGHMSEPHGHPRLAKLGLAWEAYPGYPHFLA